MIEAVVFVIECRASLDNLFLYLAISITAFLMNGIFQLSNCITKPHACEIKALDGETANEVHSVQGEDNDV